MLERLLEQKSAIILYISDNETSLTNLTFSEWELINSILNLLKPFEEITKIASYENCSISEIIPLVVTLKHYLSEEGSSFAGVGTMKLDLQCSLEKRYENIFTRENLLVATFMDPRFKLSFFEKDDNDTIMILVKNIIRKKCTAIKPNSDISVTPDEDEDDNVPLSRFTSKEASPPHATTAQEKFWQMFNSIASSSKQTDPTEKKIEEWENEFTLYLMSPVIPRKDSPFQWWYKQRTSYPILYKIATTYLSAPAGSVPSEQTFSEAGNIYESKRSRLSPDRAEKLIFLHHNLERLNFDY